MLGLPQTGLRLAEARLPPHAGLLASDTVRVSETTDAMAEPARPRGSLERHPASQLLKPFGRRLDVGALQPKVAQQPVPLLVDAAHRTAPGSRKTSRPPGNPPKQSGRVLAKQVAPITEFEASDGRNLDLDQRVCAGKRGGKKKVDRLPADPQRMLGIRSPAKPGANVLARGERVDTSSWGANAAAGYRETLARLHGAGEGLLTAHDLVLSLDDYFAEGDSEDELGFSLWTKAGAAEVGLAIVEPDSGWPPYLQVAETREEGGATVLTPVPGTRTRRLRKIVVAPLIVLAGRSGEPPYVSPVEVEALKAAWCPKGRRRIGVRTVYVTPLETVCRERADYAAWHHAMTALASALQDLPGLAVAPPCLPARPWEVAAVAA